MDNDTFTKSRTEGSDNSTLPLSTKKDNFVPGTMTENRFWLLVEISSIHSEKVIAALNEHLVLGYSRREVCERNNVSAGYLSTSLTKLLRIDNAVTLLAPR
ncbi:PabB family transcriptional regulator [Edwardsiella ictaluri]|nr:PapB/FocB family fimbrial expression transcriptional regulator [Edwardsiella ictaluri]ARD39126.1 PabB family transcriptional regulator [Edwardsiella ictaluri]AVZ82974.1 PabB family transcriptional regulator [Edwardsiella ictaluri]EKS7763650.1 PabB family transcriptional regulator [Edwardsiella ictaluri]EKS7770494.1 PabB family transcriptional regulator [Edwardsiella ictaluri]EKS7773636.1 PabB family transcriptional regulator [Edwardsiella ictaluri]